MTFLQSVLGTIELQVVSGNIPGLLTEAQSRGIPIYHARTMDPLTVCLTVSAGHFKHLTRICRRRGDSIKVLRKRGLRFPIQRLLRRKLLLTGLMMLILFFLLLPTRILFISVEGNRTLPDCRILEAAADSGLRFGVSRKDLRSEQIKNNLLEKLPSLSWAGVNTRGCTAVLTVEERKEGKLPPQTVPAGIYAVCDGIIESCTALQGTMLCRPGQAVRQDQLLISGFTEGHAAPAEARGEVYAITQRRISCFLPRNHMVRKENQGIKKRYSLLIGKKRIKFPWNSGIWDTGCGRMYEEYFVTLPGGYSLPLALAADTYTFSDTAELSRKPGAARQTLEHTALQYIKKQTISGEIRKSDLHYQENDTQCILDGQVLCREMVGRKRQEKIGE